MCDRNAQVETAKHIMDRPDCRRGCTERSEQETRCQYVGRGIQVAAILILLCTTLVGCPPRKPTPVATSAVLLDASHAPTGSQSS